MRRARRKGKEKEDEGEKRQRTGRRIRVKMICSHLDGRVCCRRGRRREGVNETKRT